MYQTKQNKTLRSALLLGAASAAALSLAAPAKAQDSGSVETVVVTGSRIPQTGLYSSSPVTVLGHEEFQETGSTNTEELLRELPSTAKDGDNGTIDNGSGGLSTVDLRGMGSNRTLVLVDGTRLAPSDQANHVDLAQIPTAMIDHIEVLTGGASSVYGGDAVSGVVNLILRKDFEGMEASGQYSVTKYGDGNDDDASLVLGVNSPDGKGNVTLYAEYYNQQPIASNARPWATQVLASPYQPATGGGCPPAPGGHGFCYFGSSRIPQGYLPGLGLIFTSAGTLVPRNGASFDFMPDEFAQSEHQRYALGAEGHYEVNKALDFYARVMFSDNQNDTQLAPPAYSEDENINCGNPLMTASEQLILFGTNTCSSLSGGTVGGTGPNAGAPITGAGNNATINTEYRARFLAAGNRSTNIRNDNYQALVGAKGDLGSGWTYDAFGSYGQTTATTLYGGDFDANKFQDTLLLNPDGSCISGNTGCVGSDIFHQQYAISPAAGSYFNSPDITFGIQKFWDLQANLVGDLGDWGVRSPWAKSAVGVAFGTEYRQEFAQFYSAGPVTQTVGSNFGYQPPDVGSYNVAEGYTEVKIPLIEGVPFFESLEADGGYRFSRYSTAGGASTWKAALSWQPIDDIKFRGSLDRAVREPHIGELFASPAETAINGSDPCFTETASMAVCTSGSTLAGARVTTAEYGGSGLDCGGQCTGYIEANPALKPEVANTRSLGVVFTPTFLDGFTATVDYYNIHISKAINSLPFQFVVNSCYLGTNPGTNFYCTLIHRDLHGSIGTDTGLVDLPSENIGNQGTKGFDFEANYQVDLDNFNWKEAGSLGFNFKGTLVQSASFDVAGETDQCAGHFDITFCPEPTPRWSHQLRVTWANPSSDVQIYGTWNYFTGTTDKDSAPTGSQPDPLDYKLPGESYFDLGFSWNINTVAQLYGGANNVLNTKPPLIDTQAFNPALDNVNTFPGLYDVLGTNFFAGVKFKY